METRMTDCFQVKNPDQVVSVIFETKTSFAGWVATQDSFARAWAATCKYSAEPGSVCLIPDKAGKLAAVWCGLPETSEAFWQAGQLPLGLPEGEYQFNFEALPVPPDEKMQRRFA